ncbi:MAG: cytochrome c biogenesis protein ResB [Bacteroidales bacterium]
MTYRFLFSPIFTGVLFIVFALSMAIATFIENDFGAAAAKQIIYGAKWFELIFLLMIINLSGQIFTFKLYQKKKIPVLLFHLSFIVMIVGAAVTRYTGFEGNIHIREGETSNRVTGDTKYMGVNIYDSSDNLLYESSEKVEVTGTSLGKFYRKARLDGEEITIRYSQFIPNSAETLIEEPGNDPVAVIMVMGSESARDVLYLAPGSQVNLPGTLIGFTDEPGYDVALSFAGDSFRIVSKSGMTEVSMAGGVANNILPGEAVRMKELSVYTVGKYRLVPQKLARSGKVIPVVNPGSGQQPSGKDAFELEVAGSNSMKKLYVYNIYNGDRTYAETVVGDKRVEVYYGPQEVSLPFMLRLDDFL